MFISLAYPGWISDKEITKQSGYLDMMETYIYRVNSPGKQESSQMLPSEKTKTNKIAKTWTLVEHAIQHLKIFRFIANEVPINMKSYRDDILQICAAISNMQIASFMGRKMDWNKTTMTMINYSN